MDSPLCQTVLVVDDDRFIRQQVTGLLARAGFAVQAFARDAEQRRSAAEESTRQDLLARLTARELEVVRLIARGLSNKEIARELGISYRTVEIHRSHIMQKLAADSVVELVQIAGPMER